MAARYWVGGSGDWNSTSRWSTTSGGTSGASVPTTADNVIFDSNSSPSNADFTVSFPNGLAASTTTVEVYTAAALATFDFSPGGTLTCTGLTISVNTVNDGLRLIDSTTTRSALLCNGTTTLTQGLLNLNGYRFTTLYFVSTNTNTRTIAFGTTGSILLTGINSSGVTTWNTGDVTGLTLSGSKNVILQANFNPGSSVRTNIVNLSNTTDTSKMFSFSINNIFYNTSSLTYIQYNFTAPSGNPTMDVLDYNSGNNSTFIVGNMTVYGTATITTGAISGNPTFVNTLTMTGGSISGSPTAQNTVVMTNASVSGTFFVQNNVTINTGCSITTLYFTSTQASQTLTTTSNLTNLTIDKSSGTVVMQQATTVTGTTTLTQGTFNLNNYTLTTTYFSSTNTNTRTLAFGTGTILLPGVNTSGVTTWNTGDVTGLSLSGSKSVFLQANFNPGSSTRTNIINLNNTSDVGKMFNFTVNNVFFNTSSLTYIQYNFTAPSGTPSMESFVIDISNVSAVAVGNIGVYGNVTSTSSYLSGTIYMLGTANQTITQTSGLLLSMEVNKSSGTVNLSSNVLINSGSTFTLTAGTLNLGTFTLSTAYFFSSNGNVRTLAFGTGSIILTGVNTTGVTVWNTGNITNLTISGSKNVFLEANFSPGTSTKTNILNINNTTDVAKMFNFTARNIFFDTSRLTYIQYNFTTPSGTPTVDTFVMNVSTNSIAVVGTMNHYGTTTLTLGTLSGNPNFFGVFNVNGGALSGTSYIYNNFSMTGGSTGLLYFTGTQTTQTLTTSVVLNSITIDKSSGSVVLQQATTTSSTITLTQGTFNLNGYTLTAIYFISTNTNTRTIAFGTTGSIVLTGVNTSGVTTWNTGDVTGLTLSGSKNVILQANFSPGSSTRTNIVNLSNTTDVAKMFNFNVNSIFYNTSSLTYIQYNFTAPSGNPTMDVLVYNSGNNSTFIVGNMTVYGTTNVTSGGISGNPTFISSLTMTGGSISGNPTAQNVVTMTNASVSGTFFVQNNIVINTGCSITTLYFTSTQVTQTLTTTSNLTNLTIDKSSGTVVMQQATTVTGTTSLTQGTFNLNNYTLTTSYFLSTNTNTRTLAFGTGTILLPGINTSGVTTWNTGDVTGLTLSGSKSVFLQANFNPGSSTRTNVVNLSNTTDVGKMFNFTVNNVFYNTSSLTYIQYNFTAPAGIPSMEFFTIDISNVSAVAVGNISVYGNVTSTSSYLSGTIYMLGTANQTITQTSGLLLSMEVNKSSGSVSLATNVLINSGSTFTLTAGTLNLGTFTLSTAYFFSSNGNVRTIAFGTGSIILTGIATTNSTVWNTGVITNLTISGSKNVFLEANFSVSSSIRTNIVNINNTTDVAKMFNFTARNIFFNTSSSTYVQYNFTAPSGTPTVDTFVMNVSTNSIAVVGTMNHYGTTTLTLGTLSGNPNFFGVFNVNGGVMSGTSYIYNNFSMTGGSTGLLYFTGTQTTQTLTTSVILNSITIDKSLGSVVLQQATTTSSTITLTQGTLNINGYTLTTIYFISSNTNTRTIAFGTTGSILLTGLNTSGVTTWNTGDVTGLSLTGSKNVILQANFSPGSSTRTNTVNLSNTTDTSKMFNFNVNTIFYNTSSLTYIQYNFSAPSGNPTMDVLVYNSGNNATFIVGNMTVYGTTNVTTGGISGNPTFISSLTMTGGSISGNPTAQNVVTMTNASVSGTFFVQNNIVINNGCSITTLYFTSTQASQTLTTTSNLTNLTIDKSSGTVVMQQATTVTGTTSLTQGTFNLNNYTLTTTYFSSTNTNTRTLAFGTTGSLLLPGVNTSGVTTWNTGDVTGLSLSGSKNVFLQANFNPGSSTRTNLVNLNNTSDVGKMFNFTVNNVFYNTSSLTYIQYNFTAPAGTPSMESFTIDISNVSAVAVGNIGVYGNVTSTSSYLSGIIYMLGTAVQNITQTSGIILSVDVNKSGGSVNLATNVLINPGSSFTLTAGTLNLGTLNLSTPYFLSTNTNTRTINFGTGSIILTGVNSSGVTVWNTGDITGLTISGSKNVFLESNFNPGSSVRTNTVNINSTTDVAKMFNFTARNIFFNTSNLTYIQYNFSAPSGTPTVDTFVMNVSTNSIAVVGSMSHYGTTTLTLGTLSGNPNFFGVLNVNGGVMSGTSYIYNNFSMTGGSTGLLYFTGTQTTQTLTTSVSLSAVTIDKSSGSVVLQQSTTIIPNNATTLTRGTFNLNNFTLTTAYFLSTNTNTRTLEFGSTGKILLPGINTSGVTTWNTGDVTGLSLTGSKDVQFQANFNPGSSTRSNIINLNNTTDVSKMFNITIDNVFYNTSSLTYIQFSFTAPAGVPAVDNLIMNPGNNSINIALNTLYVYGNMYSDSGNASGTLYLLGSKFQYFRAAGSFATTFYVQKDVGSIAELNGAFTTSSFVSLIQGTLALSTYTLTSTTFTSSNTNTRKVDLGLGTWNLTSTGNVWDMTTSTNATVVPCGSASINLTNTSTTARTFNGGSLTYGNLVIGGTAGTSTTTITGSNSFRVISSTKTVAHTLTFTAGTTTSFRELTITGTPSYTVTINSTSSTRAILRKNTVWEVGANSTNGGNNVGLTFTTSTSNPINYLSISNIEGQYQPFVGSAKTQFFSFFV